ncbi:MAG: Hsp20/alpha crystallin family protein [archaeon]|nr:Hsp20/alpha crystallin family protein [archaeon]
MSDWIDEFFEQAYDELMRPSWDAIGKCLVPLINIQDKEGEIVVTVDLPCVESREDIDLNVTEDNLEIIARMKEAIRWERWGTSQRHLEFKTFRKSIRLPEKVNPEGSRAMFRNGVLKVSLPKVRKRFTLKIQ